MKTQKSKDKIKEKKEYVGKIKKALKTTDTGYICKQLVDEVLDGDCHKLFVNELKERKNQGKLTDVQFAVYIRFK